jgi:hypothetical protein
MGLICLAGSASEKGQGGLVVAAPPVRSARKVGIMHESPQNVDLHANIFHKGERFIAKGKILSIKEVRIYRCCPNCGKGDTPLSAIRTRLLRGMRPQIAKALREK